MLSITCKNTSPQFIDFTETVLLKKSQVIIVQINAADFTEKIKEMNLYLTATEQQTIARYKEMADRNLKTISKFILKQLLAKFYQIPIAEILIEVNDQGKPFYNSTNAAPIYFNVADSADTILIAFSYEPIGIDIEKIENNFQYDDIMNAHFSTGEIIGLQNADNKLECFYRIWTRKEAILKADGAGLINNLPALSVADGVNMIVENPISLDGEWHINSARLDNSISFSLAFNDQITQLSFFNYLTLTI